MQICMVCGCVFAEGHSRQSETREHFGTPCHEMETVCPNCESDDLEEAKRCEGCGVYQESSHIKGNLCGSCRWILRMKLKIARDCLLQNLTQAQIDYIRDEMEGVIEI